LPHSGQGMTAGKGNKGRVPAPLLDGEGIAKTKVAPVG